MAVGYQQVFTEGAKAVIKITERTSSKWEGFQFGKLYKRRDHDGEVFLAIREIEFDKASGVWFAANGKISSVLYAVQTPDHTWSLFDGEVTFSNGN